MFKIETCHQRTSAKGITRDPTVVKRITENL